MLDCNKARETANYLIMRLFVSEVLKMLLSLIISYQFCFLFAFNLDIENAIVYKLPRNGQRRSYFGMTVAIRPRAGELDSKNWVLQIGAPRSNISDILVFEPGAIFRCRVSGACYLHKLDQNGNVPVSKMFNVWRGKKNVMKRLLSERKEEGWVGVAMDIKLYREGEVTTICGHRLAYQAQNLPMNIHDEQVLSVGGCYVDFLYKSNSTRLLFPLKNEDRVYYMVSNSQVDFDWGQGLAGMSAHLSNNGLLLGAPHVYYMTGTVLKYPMDWGKPFVASISGATGADIQRDFLAYNGYSVGSGNFFGDGKIWYVFGAPRSSGLHGRVYAAQFVEIRDIPTISIHRSVQRGETFGEYFGASLDVGDVNKDGFDDLIVGAPMFSQRFVDQGRVYAFLGGKLGFQQNVILNGVAEHGRFGTCVCVAGDIDQDGYKDVVVGAPYEDGGGALYIYRGGSQGVAQHASQIIHAYDVKMDMKGFGISISRAVDIDLNKYPDVLVGAYQSDEAVLLRSKRVIFLAPTIKHPQFLDRKKNQFKISVCFAYFASYPPPTISLDAVVLIDENMNRARFPNGTQLLRFYNLRTSYNLPSCVNLTVLLDMRRLNGTFSEPIQVSLENFLHHEVVNGSAQIVWENMGNVRPLAHITNDDVSERKIAVQIPFAGDCGLDNMCHSQLVLKCEFDETQVISNDEKQTFLVGYWDILNVMVTVSNLKEPAYHTNLGLITDGISVGDTLPQDSSCAFQNESLHCLLETLDEGVNRILVFQFVTKNWASTALSPIHFKFHVTTSSNETLTEDSVCQMNLTLGSHAEIHLLASPSDATIPLAEFSSMVNFSHMYEAEKKGKSPVTVTVTVSIPTVLDGDIVFAALDKDDPEISLASEINEEDVLKLTGKADDGIATRASFDDFLPPALSFPAERTLFLNCSTRNVRCSTFSYHFVTTSPSTMGRDFPIKLNITALQKMMENIDVIHFTTNGTAMIEDRFEPKSYSRKETSTSIVKLQPAPVIEMRAIVLSAIAGGLFLALIIPILVREGFFRRKTKEQMEALKVLDFINERFSIYEPMRESDRSSTVSVATVEG